MKPLLLLTPIEIGKLEFVLPSHPCLTEVATDVTPEELKSDCFRALIQRMLQIARGEVPGPSGANTGRFVGLAAPQVGVSKRLVLVETKGPSEGVDPEVEVFVNPRIVDSSSEQELRREGCYSTGNIHGLVERSVTIRVEAFDHYGGGLSATFSGFTARVMQHEIDHLEGIRFPDKITRDEHLHWVDSLEALAAYRKESENWPYLCPRDRWEAMKLGRKPGAH